MSNNIFSKKRFLLLFRQHFFHNSQLLLLSLVAYVGVIFIVLSIAQVGGNRLSPLRLEAFQGFLVALVTVFGILYTGHAFPAFRSKESTIHYLMLPASNLEKFVFEFVSRIILIIVLLPLLYWVTFNVQGYFFAIFLENDFDPIGIRYLVSLDDLAPDQVVLVYLLITGGILFVLSLALTGSAMFEKQPLVKSLFSVAVIIGMYIGYSYIVVEHLGVGRYQPPETMFLIPNNEKGAFGFISAALFGGSIVMLFVAFRKLKEREV